jgi:hypothetical protein
MKRRQNPEKIKGQIFQSIRSYGFVVWFPDLSVAIRICILACLYNLKANRNQFSKYFEVCMILKDHCTERPLLAIEVWSAEVEACNMRLFHPPLRLSIFYGSRDQLRPGSLLHKRKEPWNEVAGNAAIRYLRGQFPGRRRLMSKRGDSPWPLRSPDLTVCDFFFGATWSIQFGMRHMTTTK